MWPTRLFHAIYREDWQKFWWKVWGASQAPSPIFDHSQTTGHNIKLEKFSIVGREIQSITRTIKEAMDIRVNDPPLNRNMDKYQLPHSWDGVLQDMPALHLQWSPYSRHSTNPTWATSNKNGGTKFFFGVSMSIQGFLPLYLSSILQLEQIPPLW